jgi:hypothetical protein
VCRQLKFLTLTNCELTALPAVVRGMSRLKLLKLNINNIQVGGGEIGRHCLSIDAMI